jgi:hypothetical protein
VVRVRIWTLVGIVFVAAICTVVGASPATAAPATDACALLTAEQVGDAVGAKMSAGTTPTPEFKKTCTWTAKGVIVTLMLQDEKMYQAGKNALVASAVKPTSGVGEDAYYVVVGENVGFEVKKGSTAFKVTVYNSSMPREKRQAIERTLAQQVLSKL